VDKPVVELSGQDGNVFSIMARVAKALRRAGLAPKADEFMAKARESKSYDEVLSLCHNYVEVE
jgi:hypothetical protein